MDSVLNRVQQSKEVKDHNRKPPTSTSLDLKKDSFLSLLDVKIEPSGVSVSDNESRTSPLLPDIKNEPSSEVFDSSWLLDGNYDEAISKYVDAELEKMRHMTPEEAAAFAAEAVKEAEIAIAEAEEAEREAREAEEEARQAEEAAREAEEEACEAEEAAREAEEAELKASKKRKTTHDCYSWEGLQRSTVEEHLLMKVKSQ